METRLEVFIHDLKDKEGYMAESVCGNYIHIPHGKLAQFLRLADIFDVYVYNHHDFFVRQQAIGNYLNDKGQTYYAELDAQLENLRNFKVSYPLTAYDTGFGWVVAYDNNEETVHTLTLSIQAEKLKFDIPRGGYRGKKWDSAWSRMKRCVWHELHKLNKGK